MLPRCLFALAVAGFSSLALAQQFRLGQGPWDYEFALPAVKIERVAS